jgi:energy-converting hydrogenase Eha subunit E
MTLHDFIGYGLVFAGAVLLVLGAIGQALGGGCA